MSRKDKFEIPVIFDDDNDKIEEKKDSNSVDYDYYDKEKSLEEKKKQGNKKK